MPKVKYEGAGITSIGVDFSTGEYELSDKATKYVLETFPNNFKLVGKAPKVVEPVVEPVVEAPVEVVEVIEAPAEEVKPKNSRNK